MLVCGRTGLGASLGLQSVRATLVDLAPGSVDLIGSGWVDNADGSYTHSGTTAGEVRMLSGDGVLVEGEDYRVDLTVAVTLGTDNVVVQPKAAGAVTGNAIGAGDFSLVVTAGSDSVDAMRFICNDDGVTISDITIYAL